ncbi:MAG: hypothetical protein A3G34_14840 [Candidatus Lindowbacteria bacterium RIFCSPLOWO2_12_FULL_62_27]|nr:MAG: hypothetical protein A3I06_10120 [Candidatus Lindowbacteria bacterium RIFCSPLOWO2_02_FULL_62_12]OGH63131.1 MAG: hypothetical protein A3G34_14840 [Candidatus Lindowbacteria bacterium RIFCSPLOWO2_12_FULL_62_27]
MFLQGLRAIQRRDYPAATAFFQQAEERHSRRSGAPDEFIYGCLYYIGRCREGTLSFEEARDIYAHVPAESAYRPWVELRMSAMSQDSDGDGYIDAWEDAEGTNPMNPLAHP